MNNNECLKCETFGASCCKSSRARRDTAASLAKLVHRQMVEIERMRGALEFCRDRTEVKSLRAAQAASQEMVSNLRDVLRLIEAHPSFDHVERECRMCGAGKAGFHHKHCPRVLAHKALASAPATMKEAAR